MALRFHVFIAFRKKTFVRHGLIIIKANLSGLTSKKPGMSYEVNKQIVQMSSVCFGVLKLNKNQEGTGVAVNNNIPTIIFSSKFVHLHSYVLVNNDSLQEMIIPLKIKGE